MSSEVPGDGDEVIWATRGRSWGFRFLRRGGLDDPLAVYEDAFRGLENQPEVWRRAAAGAALRFPDPEGRRDASGRIIPHDFVLLGAWAGRLRSFDEARSAIWQQVGDEFAGVWDLDEVPPVGP